MGKVLIYTLKEKYNGGLEKYALSLSEYCNKPNEKYGYIITGNGGVYDEFMEERKIDYYLLSDKRNIKNIIRLNRILKDARKEYDTIYFNISIFIYTVPILLAKIYKYKIIIHAHLGYGKSNLNFLHYLNRFWINKLPITRLACSFVASEWLFGRKFNQAIIIPNAIDLKKYQYNSKIASQIRDKFNINPNERLIGNVGRLVNEKNQKRLLEIFESLLEKQPNYKLVIAGDGPKINELKNLSKNLDIENKVIFCGYTDKIEYLLSAMDVFVLTSYREGFPVALVEAQANGLPCVVATNVTKETNIVGNIEYVELNSSDDVWCDAIFEASKKGRQDTYKCMADAGFDVQNLEKRVWDILQN